MFCEIEAAIDALKVIHEEIHSCFERDESDNLTHPLSVAHREAMTAAYKKLHPKRKFNWLKAKEEFPDLDKDHEEVGAVYVKDLIARKESAKERLREACAPAEVIVPRSEEWLKIYSVSGSDYMSQGWGADRYAKSSAEMWVMKARFYGLEAEVRVEKVDNGIDAYRNSYRYTHFGVYAQTTALGEIILANKPELSLREAVRLLWKRGVNPRVFMPFLNPDFEEKNGLDHFGGEVQKEEAK